MSKNPKKSAPPVTKKTVGVLKDPKASKTAKSLVASVLAQTNTD